MKPYRNKFSTLVLWSLSGLQLLGLMLLPLYGEEAVSPSPKPLTLEEFIALAEKTNPDLTLFENQVSGAGGEFAGTFKPESPEFRYERELDTRKYVISQSFEFPTKTLLKAAITKKDLNAARIALRGYKASFRSQATKVFYELLAGQKNEVLAKKRLSYAENFYKSSKYRVEQGYAARFELVSAQVELLEAQQQARESLKSRYNADLNLKLFLNRQPYEETPITGELTLPQVSLSLENLLQRAMENSPELAIAKAELEKAGYRATLAWTSWLPDFTVEPFYQETLSPEDRQIRRGVFFGFKLPIWEWNTGGIQKASADKRIAFIEFEKKQRDVLKKIYGAYTDYTLAEKQLALFSPKLMVEAEDVLKQAGTNYQSGAANFLVLLEAQRSFFQANRAYTQTLLDAQAAIAELETNIGESLEFAPLPNDKEKKEKE